MINELWHGGPRLVEADGVFKLGTDSVLLSYFANTARVKHAADLGCGSGVISVLLAYNNPTLTIDGIDIDENAANAARENAALNGFSDRISITHGDIKNYRELFHAGAYDLVVSNPPYYAAGRGKPAQRTGLATARGETHCTLRDICAAAGYLTRWGGCFALVHKPERLAEIFAALADCGLEPKRLRFVQHRADSPPNLVLIEARRGGKPSLTIEKPLILTRDEGTGRREDEDEGRGMRFLFLKEKKQKNFIGLRRSVGREGNGGYFMACCYADW